MATRKRKKRILAEEIAGVVLIAFAVLLASVSYTHLVKALDGPDFTQEELDRIDQILSR